jgi:hypothetical protein
MSNVQDSKKPSKSRDAQSATAVFKIGRRRHSYRQPACVYRDWSFKPERAIKEEFATQREA